MNAIIYCAVTRGVTPRFAMTAHVHVLKKIRCKEEILFTPYFLMFALAVAGRFGHQHNADDQQTQGGDDGGTN